MKALFDVILVICSVLMIPTFFWAIDGIVHERKTKVLACLISSVVAAVLFYGILIY